MTLEKSILKTLSYFDIKNFPLTTAELADFLIDYKITNLKFLLSALDNLESQKIVGQKYGYYFLINREKLAEQRRESLLITEMKLKKARRAARFIAAVPFLKAIFVGNTVADGTANTESDIDFFVVASKNRVWFVRLYCNFILRLFNLRSYGDSTKDRICLSFFVDEKNLNLGNFRVTAKDIYLMYWIVQLVPIYDPKNYFKKIMTANFWIRDFLPNLPNHFVYQNLIDNNFVFILLKSFQENLLGYFGDFIEDKLFHWQFSMMTKSVKDKSKIGNNHVVLNGGVIKLHEQDSRQNLFDLWTKSISVYEKN